MKFHPYSEIFPLIEGTEFEALVADIKKHGLREKIWKFEGKILDGRNRFLACEQARVEPQFREFRGSSESADAFVWSVNAARRHLSASQLAMAAAKRATLVVGENQHAQKCAPSQEKAATDAGISRRSVQQARKVIDQGSKALKKAVERDEVSVSKAASVVDLPKSEQLAAATKKTEPPKPSDPIIASDWEPEIPNDEEMAAIDREIEESEARVLLADDVSTGYHNEIKRQAAEIATLKITRDGYMNGKAAVTKLLIAEQRKVAKLEKELEKLRNENESLRERVSIMEAA